MIRKSQTGESASSNILAQNPPHELFKPYNGSALAYDGQTKVICVAESKLIPYGQVFYVAGF